jgi:ADP-heptose:LPS heptosyltransferase
MAKPSVEKLVTAASRGYIERFRKGKLISFGQALAEVERILLMPDKGATGLLLALPVSRALKWKYPKARLAALVTTPVDEMFSSIPEIDKLITYESGRRFRRVGAVYSTVRLLRGHKFDLVVDLKPRFDIESALLAYLSRAPIRLGRKTDNSFPFYNLEIFSSEAGDNGGKLAEKILDILGVDPSDFPLGWTVPDRERRVAEQLIRFRKPRATEILVAFDPGPGKSGLTLSLEQQARVLDRACEEFRGRGLLLAEPDNQQNLTKLERILTKEPVMIPQPRLKDAVGLLSQSDIFLSGNTDLVYFAAAMGIPSVVFLTPADAETWYDPGLPNLEAVEIVPGEPFPISEFMAKAHSLIRAH